METTLARMAPQTAPALALDSDFVLDFFARYKPGTLKVYRNGLEQFGRFLDLPRPADAAAVAEALLGAGHGPANRLAMGFRSWLEAKGHAPNTVNSYLASLRSLVKFARRIGLVPWALDVDSAQAVPYRDTSGPGVAAVSAMIDAAASRADLKGARDEALLRLLATNALRRGEVVSLDVRHLDRETGRLWIMGKKRAEREPVTLPTRTLAAVEKWLALYGAEGDAPLFPSFTLDGTPAGRMSGTGLYKVVQRYGQAVGAKVRPHGFRHTAITTYLESTGGDLYGAQRLSRHAKADTLRAYDDNRADVAGQAAAVLDGVF